MQELIKEIVGEHAGGIKFTQLFTEICIHYLKKGDTPPDSDLVLINIKAMDDVKILEYAWDLGSDTKRVKYFVYFV